MVRTLKPLFLIAADDVGTGSATIIFDADPLYGPSLAPRPFRRDIFSTWPETTHFQVTALTPKIEGNHRFYRERVTSQVSLSGKVPYKGVILSPALPNESQLVLRCRAECRSCSSATSTAGPQYCTPTTFDLDPVPDPKSDQPFKLRLDESNGALIGDVTFRIRPRPRMPKAEDQEWRCGSESLMSVCMVSSS